ncbi:hypothetical protein D9611_000182 [Ephemerocybe angulata]|uniref:Ankyrin n=1 Tax=Ephemerocybe angulata TaxID=980116 RepID=A0A8H5BNZ3_9AGAR|nr:hypothetical protein D9611_000182 [Tulosesus angulatus]
MCAIHFGQWAPITSLAIFDLLLPLSSIMASTIPDDDRDELLLSCRYGDLEDVQAFVAKYGSDALPSVRDDNQNTILHMVSANGHLDALNYLLPLVPKSLLSAQNSAGSTPLHWAALNAHLEVAKVLVEYSDGPGIDLIDIKNLAGHSPLAEAEFSGWDEGAKYFVGVMNLDTEQADKGVGDGDAVLDAGQQIEVEIEDAEGQIAKIKIGGNESETNASSSTAA